MVLFVKAGDTKALEAYRAQKQLKRKQQLPSSQQPPPPPPPPTTDTRLLGSARDWSADFDLPEFHQPPAPRYQFPLDIAPSGSTRIDSYIVSKERRTCIGLELTAGTEENADISHQRKMQRYGEKLVPDIDPTWRFHLLCFEVGCRGYIPKSLPRALYQLGFSSAEVRRVADKCSMTARKCSYLIWIHRGRKDFEPPRLF